MLSAARFSGLCLALLALAIPAARSSGADRLILRNLDVILDRNVAAMDEDGIRLDVPRPTGIDRLTWDEIERGTVALDQARFDSLLAELGTPLYRIRQRLKIGDYEALSEPAEALYPRYADRKSPTAYMVCQAVMWSRLASGQREAAVEPYLRSFELLRSGAAKINNIPGARRLQLDAKSALSPELSLVWFDPAAAAAAMPATEQAIRSMAQPRPEGVYLYYASLAITAGQPAEAERVLRTFKGTDPQAAQWRQMLLAQQEVQAGKPGSQIAALATEFDKLAEPCRPAALFWLGQARCQDASPTIVQDGILSLLTIAAQHGRQEPELAAAGLYHAAAALDKLKDDRAAAAVRQELAAQYAGTYYGGKQKH